MQVPEVSASMPDMSGSLPEVSGKVAVPSVGGGGDVNVSAPSVDVDASLPSASMDLPGECTAFGLRFLAVVVLSRRLLGLPRRVRCSRMKLLYLEVVHLVSGLAYR